jgi:hypothetical protein
MHGLTFATKLEAGRTRRTKTIATIIAAAFLVAGCGGSKAQISSNPKQQGATQYIQLKWKQPQNAWKVKLSPTGPELDPKTAETKLTANVTGPTMFVVDIHDSTATFKDQDPLTVWTGSKSAPQPGINSTQILGPIVFTDKHTNKERLVFWDLNQGGPVKLNYSLHFNEPGVPPVDPIIDNGGCC